MMSWIRLWINQIITGTTFCELNAEERGVWFSLLVMAGASPIHGTVCIADDVPYTMEQLAAVLKLDKNLLEASMLRLQSVGKIEIAENNIIKICNWHRYQSEYERQRKYKEYKTRRTEAVFTPDSVPGTAPEPKSKVKPKKVKESKAVDMRRAVPETVEPAPIVYEQERKKKANPNDPFDVTHLEEQAEEQRQEREKERIKLVEKEPAVATSEFIRTYCEEYRKRYQTYPIITGKAQGIASRMVSELGLEKGKSMIKTYLGMNDQWFQTKAHSLETFEGNLNKVIVAKPDLNKKSGDTIIRDEQGNIVKIIIKKPEVHPDFRKLTQDIGKDMP